MFRLLIVFGRGLTSDEALVEALDHGAGQLLGHHRIVEHRRAQLLQGVHGEKRPQNLPRDGLRAAAAHRRLRNAFCSRF